jgi:LysM repeat protein
MHLRIFPILLIILLPALYSCKTSRRLARTTTAPPSSLNASEESYISAYRDIAVNEMKRTGIPASITLAQGMIESDYGRSMLAREANNHFGIKCHSDWTGQKIYHHDDRRNECFRKYAKPEDSFLDHSEFLMTGSRYRFLFDLPPADYKSWAKGLKQAGYATNPDYANMLIRAIEEKNLHYYDVDYIPAASGQVAQTSGNKAKQPSAAVVSAAEDRSVNSGSTGNPGNSGSKDVAVVSVSPKVSASRVNEKMMVAARPQRVMENNRLRYIIVRDGDTREKIEEEFQLLHWELPKYNELENDFRITPGQILYLQPKRSKAEAGKELHTVVEGDTMYEISQEYGIRLSSLYKLNRMNSGNEPEPGSTIWLRSTRPVN